MGFLSLKGRDFKGVMGWLTEQGDRLGERKSGKMKLGQRVSVEAEGGRPLVKG